MTKLTFSIYREEVATVEKVISLCKDCHCCPQVVISHTGVTIGEGSNLVRLSVEEWNILVEKVRSEELSLIDS